MQAYIKVYRHLKHANNFSFMIHIVHPYKSAYHSPIHLFYPSDKCHPHLIFQTFMVAIVSCWVVDHLCCCYGIIYIALTLYWP